MSADVVTKTELLKVKMRLEKSGKLKNSNRLLHLDDLYGGEYILACLAEDNFFFSDKIKIYISFAKESKAGRQTFIKLIRYMEVQESKKDFMKFIANKVYSERVLIGEKEE